MTSPSDRTETGALTKAAVQSLVDDVFRQCMEQDVRTLDGIRLACRKAMSAEGVTRADQPSDHQLQMAISRNCMGEGEWDYYPAYTRPPRYVSRQRVLELSRAAAEAGLFFERRGELQAQVADLGRGVRHWAAKHTRARQKVREINDLIQQAGHEPLGEEVA